MATPPAPSRADLLGSLVAHQPWPLTPASAAADPAAAPPLPPELEETRAGLGALCRAWDLMEGMLFGAFPGEVDS